MDQREECKDWGDEIQLGCDGASFGNPGRAGAGVVFRDAACGFRGALCAGGRSLKGKFSNIGVSHCYKEANFTADALAKRGASMADGSIEYFKRGLVSLLVWNTQMLVIIDSDSFDCWVLGQPLF